MDACVQYFLSFVLLFITYLCPTITMSFISLLIYYPSLFCLRQFGGSSRTLHENYITPAARFSLSSARLPSDTVLSSFNFPLEFSSLSFHLFPIPLQPLTTPILRQLFFRRKLEISVFFILTKFPSFIFLPLLPLLDHPSSLKLEKK